MDQVHLIKQQQQQQQQPSPSPSKSFGDYLIEELYRNNLHLNQYYSDLIRIKLNEYDQFNMRRFEEKDQFKNDLFFYILDHDDIHRKQFHDIAEQMTDDSTANIWMPIVKKGCMEFHDANKILQHPRDMFYKEMCEELCHMLDDHYRKDIKKGEYRP